MRISHSTWNSASLRTLFSGAIVLVSLIVLQVAYGIAPTLACLFAIPCVLAWLVSLAWVFSAIDPSGQIVKKLVLIFGILILLVIAAFVLLVLQMRHI